MILKLILVLRDSFLFDQSDQVITETPAPSHPSICIGSEKATVLPVLRTRPDIPNTQELFLSLKSFKH